MGIRSWYVQPSMQQSKVITGARGLRAPALARSLSSAVCWDVDCRQPYSEELSSPCSSSSSSTRPPPLLVLLLRRLARRSAGRMHPRPLATATAQLQLMCTRNEAATRHWLTNHRGAKKGTRSDSANMVDSITPSTAAAGAGRSGRVGVHSPPGADAGAAPSSAACNRLQSGAAVSKRASRAMVESASRSALQARDLGRSR